nr:DoxX family protein [uncultured Desulfobulbus sp.]
MLKKMFATRNDVALTVLRLALAVVVLPHGAQKVLGVFGGAGFNGTMQFFTVTMGIPYLLGLMAVLAESLGSLGLLFGFMTRLSAFGVGVTMVVAALMVHVQNGFFYELVRDPGR